MAFLKSLFAGVSALRNHQTMMDVIGNNISNINTIGFKAGRATFAEMYAQTIQSASRPTDTTGGSNPMQVGLGMSISTVDTLFNQGSIESTTNPFDMAIRGSSLFVVNQGGQTLYTRAGNFGIDATGKVVSGSSGAVLQGKMADANGVIPSGNTLQDIIINRDIKSPAKATTYIRYSGNLDASAAIYSAGPPETGGRTTSTINAFDSLGARVPLTLTFTKTGSNTWDWSAAVPDAAPATTSTNVGSGTITFNADGTLQSPLPGPITINPTSGADPLNISLDFGTPSPTAPGVFAGITQTSGNSGISIRETDGYTSGTLLSVSVDKTGLVEGSFSNSTRQSLAQIMLAEFNNPGGLSHNGENSYDISGNSGTAAIVTPGESSQIYSNSLEQSNVDLADEFTKMITAQRGFQASARIITTSDEFLQEVVNLKR
jgi:flagellar hook protein FlgE